MKKETAEKILEENKKVFEVIAQEFSETRKENWPEIEELVKFVKPQDKILDLGCGNGRLLKIFLEKNLEIDYTGVDKCEKLIEIAKNQFPQTKFLAADVLNLPFKEKEFDSVFAIAFLHHFPSEELRWQVLKNIKQILKPDGLLILSVWNLWQIKYIFKYKLFRLFSGLEDVYINWKSKTGQILKRYYYAFRKKELEKLVKDAGFKIINCYFVGNNLILAATVDKA